MSKLRWVPGEKALVNGRWQPNYDDRIGFTPAMWLERSRGRTDHQWRSYSLDGDEEVARMLLTPTYSSHTHRRAPRALLLDTIEVRADLQRSGAHVGRMVVEELGDDHRNWEIYAGPTASRRFSGTRSWAGPDATATAATAATSSSGGRSEYARGWSL